MRAYKKKNYVILRDKRLAKHFGIPIGTYDKIFTLQNGRCWICGTNDPSPYPNFQLDHDHIKGVVRGILCKHCNVGLGWFRDKISNLLAAAEYLSTWEERAAKYDLPGEHTNPLGVWLDKPYQLPGAKRERIRLIDTPKKGRVRL